MKENAYKQQTIFFILPIDNRDFNHGGTFMKISDLIESTLLKVRERLTSPFYGTFLLAWSIHNWKVYIALFSGKPTLAERMEIASTTIENLSVDDLIWTPLIVTIVIVFILNWVSLLFFAFNEFVDTMFKRVKIFFSSQAGSTPEETKRYQDQIASLERAQRNAFRELRQAKSESEQTLNQMSLEVKKMKDQIDKNTSTAFESLEEENEHLRSQLSSLLTELQTYRESDVYKNTAEDNKWKTELNSLSTESKDIIKKQLGKTIAGKSINLLDQNAVTLFSILDLADRKGDSLYLNNKGKFFLRTLTIL